MELWEMLLTADREQDLTDPVVYPGWYHSLFTTRLPNNIRIDGDAIVADVDRDAMRPYGLLPFSAAWGNPTDALWGSLIRAKWVDGIRALRHAARRVRKARTRPPETEPATAWRVWQFYVGRVRLTVPPEGAPFRGYRPVAHPAGVTPADWEQLGLLQRELVTSIDAVFQLAFAFIADGLERVPHCRGCGRELSATTATGRPSRKSVCQSCAYQAWYKKQPKKKLRERWRQDHKKRQSPTGRED